MKKYFLILIIIAPLLNAQWNQSSLNAGFGRSLYSDGTNIYAATSQGVYYTNDTGEPWFSIGPQNEDLFTVIKINDKLIAGSGASHGVFLSTNNGQDWYQPPTLSAQAVYCLVKNDNFIFAGTWGDGVFRSSDNGESWQSAGLDGKGLVDIITVGNTVFTISPDFYTKIYYSTDNGNTWNSSSLGYPASDPHGLYYNDGKLFACDDGLWASTDMGISWHNEYGLSFDSTGYPIIVKKFFKMTKYNQYLIASVMFESIHISSDNGESWSPFNEGLINDWTFADLEINGSYIWALRGFFGNAYRRPVIDLVTDLEEENSYEYNFQLEQNYPNPFNPSTIIRYNLPAEVNVILKVYDLLGTEVASLVDEEKPAGAYQVELNGINLASGIYLYRLQAGEYVNTRKMILLK